MLITNLTSKKTKIWFMRQAGRYLPEYREVRKEMGSFLNLCYSPKKASLVTLQPIDRFDLDAAIIFSDILVILDALGTKVFFIQGEGPKIEVDLDYFIEKNKNLETIEKKIKTHLEPVYQAITLTRAKLATKKSLIGFAGAFWTIFCYLIEGEGSKTFTKAKIYAYEEQEKTKKLQKIISFAISCHLNNQIEAGCDTIKIFDSWAGGLTTSQTERLVLNPTRDILDMLKNQKATKILFSRGVGNLDIFCQNLDFDVIALDSSFPIKNAKKLYEKYGKITQGNLDNFLLASKNISFLEKETKNILQETKEIPHIFNLGHGIIPTTPIKNIERIIEIIRNY